MSSLNMEFINWRDKEVIRYIAAVDTILAILLFGFYLVGGVFLNTIIIDIINGPLSRFTLIVASGAVWVGVFFINFLQMQAAYNVFIVTYQDALGPQVTIKKCQHWMRISFVVLGLVTVKLAYLSTRVYVLPVMWFVCGFQIFIRVLAIYFIRESIDDLKQEIFVSRKALSSTKSLVSPASSPQAQTKSKDNDNSKDKDRPASPPSSPPKGSPPPPPVDADAEVEDGDDVKIEVEEEEST